MCTTAWCKALPGPDTPQSRRPRCAGFALRRTVRGRSARRQSGWAHRSDPAHRPDRPLCRHVANAEPQSPEPSLRDRHPFISLHPRTLKDVRASRNRPPPPGRSSAGSPDAGPCPIGRFRGLSHRRRPVARAPRPGLGAAEACTPTGPDRASQGFFGLPHTGRPGKR